MSSVSKVIGSVKWFNAEKGFGFVTVTGLEKDVFLHVKQLRASGITGSPAEGESLTFEINDGPRGKFATAVSKT